MPNSPALWIAAGLLWMLDASINVSMEPFRALVGDMLPDRQRSFGFAMQSLFIGVGAVAASALPWILANWAGVSNVAAEGAIPDSVKWAFYIGAVAFIVAVSWTVFRTREYSPAQFAEFHAQHATGATSPPAVSRSAWQYRAWGTAWILAGSFFSVAVAVLGWDRQLHVLGIGGAAFGLLQLAAAWLQSWGRTADALWCIMNDLFLHAAHDAPARRRPVPVLVRPVRDVDLHDVRGHVAALRHDRHGFRGVQRGRQLGGRAVRGL